MVNPIEGLSAIGESIAKTTQDVQGSLGYFKEFFQDLSILLDDVGIILLYLLYIALFFFIPRLMVQAWRNYKRNNDLVGRILFIKTKRPRKSKKKKGKSSGSGFLAALRPN